MLRHANKIRLKPVRATKFNVMFSIVVVAFSGFGVYLLQASRADVAGDDQSFQLSLMPATATVAQGDYINVAVNLETSQESVDEVRATVTYPAGAMELQSVQQVCPKASFDAAADHAVAAGAVTIVCAASHGVSGKQTVANLTFKALSDSHDAPISVSDSSTVKRHGDGARVHARRHDASMSLSSHAKLADKRPRQVPQYGSRRVCSDPAPGRVRCKVRHATDASGNEVTGHAAQTGGLGPKEFHMAYQLPCTPGGPVAAICPAPSSYASSPLVAIVEAGNYKTGVTGLENDLQTFDQQLGLPACTTANGCLTVTNQTGGTSLPGDMGWTGEMYLDVEAVHMICQTCRIQVVEAADDYGNSLDAANNFAASLHPVAISNSWSSDGKGNSGDSSPYNHLGIAQVIADGDDGYESVTGNEPADFTQVVTASGTTLKVNNDGTWAGETLWSGSGASCSQEVKAPAWQKALSNWATAGCGTQRGYGDLAADADPSTGMMEYGQGKWDMGGGTSLSAPLLAGMFALAFGIGANTEGASQLYTHYASSQAGWHDITIGNDCTAQATAHCTAGPGYDVPSGLGSPKGLSAFMTANGSASPAPSPSPAPTPTPTPTPGGKKADLNGDGKVNLSDLSMLLSSWGKANAHDDLNGNGKVDLPDLSTLLSEWG